MSFDLGMPLRSPTTIAALRPESGENRLKLLEITKYPPTATTEDDMPSMHTFTVRRLKMSGFETAPPIDNSLHLEGGFLLNGNLRTLGEAQLSPSDPSRTTAVFEAPPPRLEIQFNSVAWDRLLQMMLANWASDGFVINFETATPLALPTSNLTTVTRYSMTFERVFG